VATQQEYAAGTAALQKLLQADVSAQVPAMFQDMVPADMISKLAAAGAKAVTDAVDALRAKEVK